ncbi:M15 family metallopeptidase [Luteimonas sp. gir]|uniref:M15 family metallopeptidase n=1 Tax=Luteimonas sp. gir TaxID=3127960 RepID=UPI003075BAC9
MRRPPAAVLFNTPDIELWPATLLRARANRDARVLARASWVLRRKRDGRYLAALLPEGLMPLLPDWRRTAGLDAALDLLDTSPSSIPSTPPDTLPVARLQARLDGLGIEAHAYAAHTGLSLVPEPTWLAFAGVDRYLRPLWLEAKAARAWARMREAAWGDGIVLEAISGYRSHDYQLGIFERKRARGLDVDAILEVNAAPGYSEHHSGSALDIGTPGEPSAETSFEATPAFAWLTRHAAEHGFAMSYPQGNPHGIVYEPWHWRHR